MGTKVRVTTFVLGHILCGHARAYYTKYSPTRRLFLVTVVLIPPVGLAKKWTCQNAPEVAPYTQGKEFYSYGVASGVPAFKLDHLATTHIVRKSAAIIDLACDAPKVLDVCRG